jgi:hypothetical protein
MMAKRNLVYIVISIRDHSLSQTVRPEKVFTVRSEAVKYAKEMEEKATVKWYKVLGREFIDGKA